MSEESKNGEKLEFFSAQPVLVEGTYLWRSGPDDDEPQIVKVTEEGLFELTLKSTDFSGEFCGPLEEFWKPKTCGGPVQEFRSDDGGVFCIRTQWFEQCAQGVSKVYPDEKGDKPGYVEVLYGNKRVVVLRTEYTDVLDSVYTRIKSIIDGTFEGD